MDRADTLAALLTQALTEVDRLLERVTELEAMKQRAEEMACHEPGFGGSVARYILGEA
jgi:hypothetical protein